MNQQSSKNISCEVFEIQHEIYSASDWLGGSPENSWQIRTTNRKSGIEECEAPECPLPLYPPMSCDLLHPKWEAINKESNFVSSFHPYVPYPYIPCLPSSCPQFIAIFVQSLILLSLACHLSETRTRPLNWQNQDSKHGLAPRVSSQTIGNTFGNPRTVFGTT